MAEESTTWQGRAWQGKAEHVRAGLGDQEAALVLWGQGLGKGWYLAKLPGFQEFRFVLKLKAPCRIQNLLLKQDKRFNGRR